MKNLPVVSINGSIVHTNDARISPFDRSLRLGDGLFETIRVHKGRVAHLTDHLNRLQASAVVLDFPAPDFDSLVNSALDFIIKRYGEETQ